jgi:hypothetical protein
MNRLDNRERHLRVRPWRENGCLNYHVAFRYHESFSPAESIYRYVEQPRSIYGVVSLELTHFTRTRTPKAKNLCNEAQAPTAEMAETPPSIKKSAPTTYAESSDAR